jgi:tetratricopeptide (TPR) repeat protein
MAFRFNEQFTPSSDDGESEIARLKASLEAGEPTEKTEAAQRLAALGAEGALTDCLASQNELTVHLSAASLWEVWLNERGPEARREMDRGIELLNQGRLEAALEAFARLAEEYPDWAEPLNKQATVLYMLGSSLASLRLCRKVVELKPNHFGAWNGRALCAAQLEKWREALTAARRAHRLQPSAQGNLDLIQIAEEKLREKP